MANFEIPEILEYIDRIRKLEPTDPAHADLFNAMFQALINNGAFLKKMQEKQAADAQEQTQQQYEQLTGYTDMKIGELINGAPETLDTIKEVADAILENETIVEALNEAVGKKLNKDGDLTDTTVTFTSEDDENPTTWTAMRKVVSGKLKDILVSVSIMAKNLNYLRKMLGTDDISMLGNGTLTGAVSKLNTDILKENEVGHYYVPEPKTNSIFVSLSHWVFNIAKFGRVVTITTNFGGHMKAIPLTENDAELLVLPEEYRPYAWYKIFTYVTQDGITTLINIGSDGRVGIHNLGKEINGWIARWTVTYISQQ